MSRLVGLYPPRWRARYEAELRDALALRPLTWRDRAGLLRGALDAWLHPELAETGRGLVTAGGGALPMAGGGPAGSSVGVAAAAFAALAFAAMAGLTLFRESWAWGDRRHESLWLLLAAVALGIAIGCADWRTGRPIVRIGAAVMVSGAVLLAVPGWALEAPAAGLALAAGALIAGVGALLGRADDRKPPSRSGARRPGRLLGLALLGVVAAAVLWRESIHGTALAFLAAAGTGGWLAIRSGTGRPRIVAGLVAAVLAAVLVAGLTVASPWSRHDGYALGCEVDAATCAAVADRMAAAMRAHFPGQRVRAIEVRADGQIRACHAPVDDPVDLGCRLGPDDGWPTWAEPGAD